MVTVKESVLQERARLETAFQALEQAAKKAGNFSQQHEQINTKSQSETFYNDSPNDALSRIEDIVRSHEEKILGLKEEISSLSMELVKIKDENRALKDNNKKAADILGESINVLEKLVA